MSNDSSTGKTYQGVIVPMITPITKEGALDEPAVRRVIENMVNGGVQGIFLLGTTGEGPSTPREIRSRLVHLAVEHTAGRAQLYAGIFDQVVSESLDAAREYLKRGVTAVVAQLPGYYHLPPDGQFHYFASLAERISGPMLLYDIPATVHMSIDPGVVEHLRAFRNVVGIKDSSGNPERLAALLESYADDQGFSVLVGATSLAAYGFTLGADGFVPSLGNLNPALCVRLYAAALKGDQKLMEEIQQEIGAQQEKFLVEGYIGRGIARLKYLMAQQGLCTAAVFPPLQEEDVA